MQQQEQYVGIDLHRRRSVIVRVDEHGEHLSTVRIDNDVAALAREVAKAGEHPEVVIEATYGWYWAVDTLQELGATVHLAHPSGLNWGQRRRKDDERDALDLVDMLRLGRLPESWIAPPATRELRELVRHRAEQRGAIQEGMGAGAGVERGVIIERVDVDDDGDVIVVSCRLRRGLAGRCGQSGRRSSGYDQGWWPAAVAGVGRGHGPGVHRSRRASCRVPRARGDGRGRAVGPPRFRAHAGVR